MYVMFLCRPGLLECWGLHLGGSRTGVETDLGGIMGFYFCVGGDLVFECLSCGLLGVFWWAGLGFFSACNSPSAPVFLPHSLIRVAVFMIFCFMFFLLGSLPMPVLEIVMPALHFLENMATWVPWENNAAH